MRPLGILGGAMSGAAPGAPNGSSAAILGFTNVTTFTAAGTSAWTVPAGVTSCFVEVFGAGAGGSGSGGDGYPSYGGGYSAKHVAGLSPGASVSVTVGAGGAGSSGSGAGGGTSSFGVHLSATGGASGFSGPAGAGIGGDINISACQNNHIITGTYANGGSGAPAGLFWRGGMGGRSSTTASGGAGLQPGGAGGNGASATGGNGAPGMVIIYW